jgi:hypothetical protein
MCEILGNMAIILYCSRHDFFYNQILNYGSLMNLGKERTVVPNL